MNELKMDVTAEMIRENNNKIYESKRVLEKSFLRPVDERFSTSEPLENWFLPGMYDLDQDVKNAKNETKTIMASITNIYASKSKPIHMHGGLWYNPKLVHHYSVYINPIHELLNYDIMSCIVESMSYHSDKRQLLFVSKFFTVFLYNNPGLLSLKLYHF